MYDYIVIGSGIAGLFTALLAAKHGRVLVITKAALEESNTRYAQGGIAAPMAPEDSPALHFRDTVDAGAGLCDERAVRVLTEEAAARINDLLAAGVPFDREHDRLALGLEAAHGMPRVLHAGGDATGYFIEHALCGALEQAGVAVLEKTFVTRLHVENGRAAGVATLSDHGPEQLYRARHIVLASGGAGRLFRHTTNPAVATGDGSALAYRAGAALADLEFYQFHPTALQAPGAGSFLISEAVRGEGALLRNASGERFMLRYDARAELAPRDVVARAIAREMEHSRLEHVFLDLRHLPPARVLQRFPSIAARCKQLGLDIAREPLPVAPAAHYAMGGVRTNVWGQTTLPGLFACGEVAASGVHGANRLASNSLLEGIVFGARIVQRTAQPVDHGSPPEATTAPGLLPDLVLQPQKAVPADFTSAAPSTPALQRLMWEQLGLMRSGAGLEQAVRTLSRWEATMPAPRTVAEHELHNGVLLGRLMAIAALRRTESRGAHYRSDTPDSDAAWRRHIVLAATPVSQEQLVPEYAGAGA